MKFHKKKKDDKKLKSKLKPIKKGSPFVFRLLQKRNMQQLVFEYLTVKDLFGVLNLSRSYYHCFHSTNIFRDLKITRDFA